MPVAKATKSPTTKTMSNVHSPSKSMQSSTQSRFATSKLIKNLGSGNDGIQFSFSYGLRTAHGRD